MFNYQNRGISTLSAIGIIAVLVVVVVGGILGYQYFSPQKNNNLQQRPSNQTNDIQPSITVVSPNGGEVWTRGSTYDITWTSTGVNKVTIWVWKEGASDVAEIITGTSQVSASLGKYTWTIPTNNNDINLGGNFKVSISALENQGIKDSSDNYFSIVAPTNQTADWKTYTNTQYGFEIKYPSNFKATTYTDPAGMFHLYLGYNNTPYVGDISIKVFKSNETVKQYFEKRKIQDTQFYASKCQTCANSDVDAEFDDCMVNRSSKIQFANQEGYYCNSANMPARANYTSPIYVSHNGNMYEFRGFNGDSQYKEQKQIFSTFKFTK